MKQKILEHLFSIIFVTLVLVAVLLLVTKRSAPHHDSLHEAIEAYRTVSFIDFNDPFQKILFKEVLDLYYPDKHDEHEALVAALGNSTARPFTDNINRLYTKESLSWNKFGQLIGMFLKFCITYVLVMGLTYYGVQTVGVWQFIRKKQTSNTAAGSSKQKPWLSYIQGVVKRIGKGFAYGILFSPAYVIAYSIRTEFNTDTLIFMIFLGVVSNGLLITYARKFYTFLVTESRKGYVETARVKNLDHSYEWNTSGAIAMKAVIKPLKRFEGHVFHHIYTNARFQYISTLKEQASFLITGLIIIEMALNIHGYLNYEMLRQILYRNYDVVIVIFLGIFYVVKGTEIFTDYMVHRESLKYENR